MSRKIVFIFEFIAGGGFNQDEIPPSLFCEGFGMLRAIIADFKELDFEIITLLDQRISSFSPYLEADEVNYVNQEDDYVELFMESVIRGDYCYIIAPEFSKILYKLTELANEQQKAVLSIGLNGIELGTHKLETYKFFKKHEVLTPKTYLIPWGKRYFDINFVYEKFRKLNCPIVIKLEDGVGADSIFYFESEAQLDDFFKGPEEKLDIVRNFILQEYIEGIDLSVSLIGTSKGPIILSINTQNIDIKNNKKASEYFGGLTPIENYVEIKNELEVLLKNLDLSEYTGYYGIDFIRKHDGTIYLIEINPRLTTSYVGIRNIINLNPVQLIIDSNSNKFHPNEISFSHVSHFSRIELEYIGSKRTGEIYKNIIPKLLGSVPEFITPPISLQGSLNEGIHNFSCFIATKEKSYESSEKRFEEILETLREVSFKVIK